MDGNQPTFHSHVHVVNLSTLPTPLTVQKDGYNHMRHDEIRNTFANLMSEVRYDVEIEPKLQSLQGESFVNISTTTIEDARLDEKANGFWGSRFSRTFFDVKVFKPHAKSSLRLLKDAYKHHESLKNSRYQMRVL